jgi:hypothetical protein
MKVLKFISVVLTIAVLAACSQQATLNSPETDISAQAPTWQKLGGVIDATLDKSPFDVVMVLDRTEKPVVASLEDDNKGNYKVYFQKWTGTTWQSFAPSMVVAKTSYPSFDFQIDLNNRPVVAVEKNTSSGLQDVVYRFENNTWKQFGDPSDSANLSPNVDLAIAPNGNIFTLVQDKTTPKSYMRRWNGTTWLTLYTFQKTTTYAGETFKHEAKSLMFTKTSRPVVTWQLTGEEWPYAAEPEFNTEVWNDTAWVQFQPNGLWGEFMVDKNDRMLEAYVAANHSSSVSCGIDVTQGGTSFPKIENAVKYYKFNVAVDSGNSPVIAHTVGCAPDPSNYDWPTNLEENKQDLVVRRWSGSSWQTLGLILDRVANRGAWSQALAVDSKNAIYVLFTHCVSYSSTTCTNYNLYLSKY